MKQRIEEINQLIRYKDYPLARRRLLDFCFDTRDNKLLRQAIDFSKQFNEESNNINTEEYAIDFSEKSNQLFQQLNHSNRIENTSKLVLSANEVGKRYRNGGFTLSPLSLDLYTNKIIGVVGENGHGKTTLLRCLAAQLKINNGNITYHFLEKTDYYTIKQNIAFIPQRIPKWYGKLKDNLHFSSSISGNYGMDNELMVDFMLERLGLTKFENLTWNQISSGYRTKFEIASILLKKPTLLILDEPLANLDIKAQQTLLTDLKYLSQSFFHPLSIILSSQQLHEVEKVADTILFIKQGNCITQKNNTNHNIINTDCVIEVETNADRDTILQILNNKVTVSFNGGFYTITSTELNTNQIIELLLKNNISISYFRDITNSAKRLFN
jgi:ABC-2 type transport system ATP-binding protein